MAYTVFSGIGCRNSIWLANWFPVVPKTRANFYWTEFIKTDYFTMLWLFLVELLDTFFFDSSSGSVDSFHVFVR